VAATGALFKGTFLAFFDPSLAKRLQKSLLCGRLEQNKKANHA